MTVADCILAFEPIGLEETNAQAQLLRRVDTKYVIRPDQLEPILLSWVPTHRILEINGRKIFHYHSVYYDTPGLDLYHAHHAGAATRVKFRLREYADSDLSYYEIKLRSNSGVTDKQRQRIRAKEQIPEFLQTAVQENPRHLKQGVMQETLSVDYDRITLVAKEGGERVTIDLHLRYRVADREKDYSDRVIIEVKHGRGVRTTERDRFRRMGIRPGSISKYCLGVLSLYPAVKQNRFKLPLRILAKQLNDYGAAECFGGSGTGIV
ncbi:MAG: polyphosphate polymerase domain-containing protein [Bacteroidetes bacterium]|nr:polyphosphate polymerase domain-containing protein [Bacteroidota bacterium]